MDRRPILCVGANVDVELNASRGWRGVGSDGWGEGVGEADVEGTVCVRVECVARLACDVAGAGIVITDCIFDLYIYAFSMGDGGGAVEGLGW